MYTNKSFGANTRNDMAVILKAAQYSPSSPEERVRGISTLLPVQEQCGFVFMLAYTKKEGEGSETLLQTLNDQVHRLANSFGKDANPQHRFEQFLGALNETLASQIRDGRWYVPIDQVHAMVGVATRQQMYISGTGELTALFLHRKPSQRYQIFNLFRGIQTEQSLPTWEKPFAIVLDGDLHPDDVFCVSDKNVQHEIEQEELNQILTTLPPTSAVEKIRQCFSPKDAPLLIVLKTISAEQKQDSKIRLATPTADLSIEKLENTVESTDRLLDDQRPKLSYVIQYLLHWLKSRTKSKSRILQDVNARDTTINTLKRIGRVLLRIALFLGKRFLHHAQKTTSQIFNKHERKKIVQNLKLSVSRTNLFVRKLLSGAKQIPRSTKYLAFGIAVAIFALIVGIVLMTKAQTRAQDEKEYQERIHSIEDVMERAAGAVIYQDEAQARSLYLNAQTLIEGLQTDTPQRASKATDLSAEVQSAMNEIRHLVTIPNPPLLADLSQNSVDVTGNSIAGNPESIYVFGSDGRVYSFNRTNKKFDVEISPQTPVESINASQEEGRYCFLGRDGAVYFVEKDKKEIAQAGIQNVNWVDLEAYANRVYLLSPSINGQQGQIVRFDRFGNELAKEHQWITSSTTQLNDAVGISIDGSIYVLMKNGTILRFDGGNETGWRNEVVEPQITAATKIWTGTDSKFIYVLEPTTNKIVVFQKETGAFVVQYRSDAFNGLSDFLVDEKGYTIYLLAGPKLYSIAASHLE
jgi:hypothetical protein